MGRLEGKVAIVTGAARGTGEATARLFVDEGARVVLADVRDESGEGVAKELGDAARYEHLDVTSEDDWKCVVDRTTKVFDAPNVLVNNAAILHMAAIVDTTLADFERVVRVNQLGTFLGIRAVVEAMKSSGGGSIVNISSIDGLRGQNGLVAYVASKWGVRGITRVAALELGRFGIRVNDVCPEAGSAAMIMPYVPSGVDIEAVAALQQPALAPQRNRSIQDRVNDIATLVAFLASDDSASCTGADLRRESLRRKRVCRARLSAESWSSSKTSESSGDIAKCPKTTCSQAAMSNGNSSSSQPATRGSRFSAARP
jgi:3alpha(or 20beta)-hydroxysteroid dehydrogenase